MKLQKGLLGRGGRGGQGRGELRPPDGHLPGVWAPRPERALSCPVLLHPNYNLLREWGEGHGVEGRQGVRGGWHCKDR